MVARVHTFRLSPDDAAELQGYVLVLDRRRGTGMAVTVWNSERALNGAGEDVARCPTCGHGHASEPEWADAPLAAARRD